MIEILNKYYEDGWLIKQTHPTLPLTIWNYSATTQYKGYWDEITLQCRGLVTDDKGVVVARPFKKFFNMDENKHTPTSEFDVFDKLDGSLGILFMYDGEWIFASRGSFTSEQAIRGRELLNKYDLDILSTGYTYLFEIIYPENRIVVDYDGLEDVVLLGCVEITDGFEVDIYDEYYTSHFNVVKRYDGIKDYSTLKQMIFDNQEGFVVRFSNGDRMKIKGDEYVRLHRIMTNISTTSVWEVLSGSDSMESYLQNVPDEFYNKVRDYEAELNRTFNEWKDDYNQVFDIISEKRPESRKEWATLIKEYDKEYWGILFKMIDGKDYDELIWKQIKPEYQKL